MTPNPSRDEARRRLPALIVLAALLLAAGACTTTGRRPAEEPNDLWSSAREALAEGEFIRAEQRLSRLLAEHQGEPEGREALFYLGLMHLDPRNPSADPATAAEELRRYMHQQGIERRAEAVSLFALARQLSLPPEQPVVELVPEGLPRPVVAPGEAADPAEVARLRAELASRNAEIARLREEMERIRRTLAPAKPR